jgi:molybdopterin-guanine dinucleotide biosynthesis protein A
VIPHRDDPPALSVVIQAGGESRRMGRDKGLVAFLGQPLVARLAQRLRPIASELLLTTNSPSDYAFLGLPLHADLLPGTGALGGLYTALQAARCPLAAVVACDMPFSSPELLDILRAALWRGGYDLAVPRSSNGLEPFHAVYRRESCLPHIRAALQDGKRRVDSWFHAVRLYQHPWEKVLEVDPAGRIFLNVNTPDELAEAERLAQEL